MADIELVIRVSEEIYESCKRECEENDALIIDTFTLAVGNGSPLPKGHKRLIEDNFEVGPVFDKEGHRIGYKYVTQEGLNNALTIIEADKESEDMG